ncbi:hypothetical protein Tco_0210001 [Tanacetum coccineum]
MTCSTTIILDSPKTDSLIMVDKHLGIIPETKSDEFIKSSVENLVQTQVSPRMNASVMCPIVMILKRQIFRRFPILSSTILPLVMTNQVMRSEFNSIHNEDLDSTPKNDRFDTKSYLLESLLNRDTLMASSPKNDSLLDEFVGELKTIPLGIVNTNHEEYISLMEREEIDIFHGLDDSIPPGIESDDFNSEGDDNSTFLPEFESFHVDYPDSGDSTIDVVEDIPVDVPNILPTHPALHMDFDFIPSHNDLESDLDVSSPFGDRNKIYDPGICIEVDSMRFLATHSPVIDTLLPFSSENEDKTFNHGILASKEKSHPYSSHRGFKASKLFHHKSLMLTHGDNTPNLGDFSDCDDSRARGFCPSFTRASNPQLHFGNPISKSYRLTFIFKHT